MTTDRDQALGCSAGECGANGRALKASRALLHKRTTTSILGAACLVAWLGLFVGGAGAQSTRPSKAGSPPGSPTTPAPATTLPPPAISPTNAAPTGGPRQPASASTPSAYDKILKPIGEREYTLRVHVNINSYQTPANLVGPSKSLAIGSLRFKTAAIVFPILPGCSSCDIHAEDVVGVMSFDDRPEDTVPTLNGGYHSGTRLGRWELRDKEGREASLALDIPMTTWRTQFDEAAAFEVPWPKGDLTSVAASTFNPQLFIDRDKEPLASIVNVWCEGNDPMKLPPAKLAKFLAGKVLDAVQPSGTGQATARNGQFAGVDLKGANQTLIEGRGSEHDIACLLAAVYRNAGLPARTVIGYDITLSKGSRATPYDIAKSHGGPNLRSWVEFCLLDEATSKEIWIPVDIVRMRKSSSRAPALDKHWKFFGENDELDTVLPFAFQFHPPTTVVAHGAVAFWGWLTQPETQAATQWLTFDSMTTANRGAKQRGR